MSQDDGNGLFDSEYYFKLGDAVDDVSTADGAKEKTVAGAKLVGKTLSNFALFSGKLGLEILKKLPETLENHKKK